MNIDIRQNVIGKLKGDSEEELLNTLNESVSSKDELVLPGLGVMFELFWNDINESLKKEIVSVIKSNISK